MNLPRKLAFVVLLLVGYSACAVMLCNRWADLLDRHPNEKQLLEHAQELGLEAEPMRRLLKRGSQAELRELARIFDLLVGRKPMSREDYSSLARILARHRADGFLQFHGTVEGTIEKILTSQIDGRAVPHMRPGNFEWAIYALSTPPVESKLGPLRVLSSKSQGKEMVVFQGEAAKLFKDHPPTGVFPFWKWLTGEKIVAMKRIVIDEYKQLDDHTLVVTKAHLEPLKGGILARAYAGLIVFHTPELILAPATILCLLAGC